MQPQEDDP
jgi:hypothetical protein